MANKVLYIGNFKPWWSTETYVAKAFENIEWEVDRVQEDELDVDDVVERCKSARFLLWTRTWVEQEDDIKRIFDAIKIPTASVHLDLYLGISREDRVGKDLFWLTDFCFTADGGDEHAKQFKGLGINHYFLPPGVDRDGCYLAKLSDEFKGIDIVFLGSRGYHKEYPQRPQLIEWLEREYPDNFKHLGHESNIWGDRKNALFTSVKICIGDTLRSPRYTSDRLIEGCGRGAFMITPRIEGLELYEDGVHVVEYEYEDFEQLKELIDYYLEHDDERDEMRARAIEHTLQNHTWDHRVAKIIEVMGLK